jgi:succinate dehydrogenase / fumarate reductase flavoprotein subunit
MQAVEDRVQMLADRQATEDGYALRTEMTVLMREHYGLFRDEATMKAGLDRLITLRERADRVGLRYMGSVFNVDMIRTYELEGMLDVALAVAAGALARTESRGSHYRTDYSTRDDGNWLKHTLAFYQPGVAGPRLDYAPVTLGTFEPQERTY